MTERDSTIQAFHNVLNSELHNSSLNFPICFDSVTKISKMAEDDSIGTKDFANLIQRDPIVLAKAIRMANTAAIKGNVSKHISNPIEVVQRLGIKKLRCLIYSISLEQLSNDLRSNEIKAIASITWKHSLDVGCWAYVIAKHTKLVDPDTAMLTGLMVDVGQFYILSKLHNYPAIEGNFDDFSDIVLVRYDNITRLILDILMLPKEIIKVYEVMYLKTPVFPVTNLVEIFLLATVITELPNPLLNVIEKYKKKIFYEEIEDDQMKDFNKLVTTLIKDKREIFNVLTSFK